MKAQERRAHILHDLKLAQEPVTAVQLAQKYDVSRQVIVGDIALLRAANHEILATNQGYLMNIPVTPVQTSVYRGKLVCQHCREETERELKLIVDLGGRVEDVQVDHPVYGILKASLKIDNYEDIRNFIAQMEAFQGEMLSSLTQGIHIHTIITENLEDFLAIKEALQKADILYK